jgi:hypothetical protein
MMKKQLAIVGCLLTSTILTMNVTAQRETYDIATFTAPEGWERIDSNGIIMFQDSKTNNGLTSFCQIFLYPSRPSNNNAIENFQLAWIDHVTKSTGTKAKPKTETTPDGWTAISGYTNIARQGMEYTCMLVSASGFGKTMSVMINIAGKDYLNDVQTFLDKLKLDPNAVSNSSSNDKQTIVTGPASLSNYVYVAPAGWITTSYPDGIVLSSPAYNTGEKCNITLWPMRTPGGNLQADANSLFNDVFKSFVPKQSSTQPSVIKGTSAQGWDYLMIKQPIGIPGGDYQTMFGFVFVAQLDDQLAAISGISKDPLVSSCFGLQLTNVWPAFFYSLQFKNWNPSGHQSSLVKKLFGAWTTVTASAGDRFVFAPNGRFAGAAAAQRYYRISSTEVLRIADAFFGDGTYSISNNQIILTHDNDKNNPEIGLLRIEQESMDGGRNWIEKLYLLRKSVVDGSEYEVCYDKQDN